MSTRFARKRRNERKNIGEEEQFTERGVGVGVGGGEGVAERPEA